MTDYPYVCANCKWWAPGEPMHAGTCHRYPDDRRSIEGAWCGEFAVINPNVRPIRRDIAFAGYQMEVGL